MATQSLPKSDKKKKASVESVVAVPVVVPYQSELQRRFIKSGYFFGALLAHLILLVLVWTFIIFRAPKPQQPVVFQAVVIPPPKQKPEDPPPPSPPDQGGGGDFSHFTIIPPSGPPINTTPVPTPFHIPQVKATGLKFKVGSGPTTGPYVGPHKFTDRNGPDPTVLTGYLYDLKQTTERAATGMTPVKYHDVLSQFISSNWDDSVLNQYYKSPNPLSTSDIFIPTLNAADGPKAFGVEKEVKPNMYVILYKVTVSPPQDGTYHFVGVGDDICAVEANGQTVYDGSASQNGGIWSGYDREQTYHMPSFVPSWAHDADIKVGTALHLLAGQRVPIEVLIGEQPGGRSNYFVMIQRDEDLPNYKKDGDAPILPIFQLDQDPIKIDAPVTEDNIGGHPPYDPNPSPWKGYGP